MIQQWVIQTFQISKTVLVEKFQSVAGKSHRRNIQFSLLPLKKSSHRNHFQDKQNFQIVTRNYQKFYRKTASCYSFLDILQDSIVEHLFVISICAESFVILLVTKATKGAWKSLHIIVLSLIRLLLNHGLFHCPLCPDVLVPISTPFEGR